MMASRNQRYAVLIPSRSRPQSLMKLFRRCPSLDCSDTFVALERRERVLYREWLRNFHKVQIVWIDNPRGQVSVAREVLRKKVTSATCSYERYILSDDDIVFSDDSLRALVETHQMFTDRYGECVVAGLSTIYRLYNRDKVDHLCLPIEQYHTYAGVSFVFWCVPNTLYDTFTYPNDCALDDVYLALFAIRKGMIRWRVCVEASYEQTVPRWGSGGLGSVSERVYKNAIAIARIAQDFPEWMSPSVIKMNIPLSALIDFETARQRRRSLQGGRHD